MTKQNPVEYAENVLGVNAIWQQAEADYSAHATAQSGIKNLNAQIHILRMNLEDRERTVASEANLEGATSKTAVKEAVKAAVSTDSEAYSLRREIAGLEHSKSVLELDARHSEYGMRLYSERMHQLGGLLFFYGAAKMQNKPTGN